MAESHNMQHPDQVRVRGIIQKILDQTRRIRGWEIEMMEYDFYTSAYNVRLILNENHAKVKIPSEWIDEYLSTKGVLRRRRLKRALKLAVKPFADLDD